MRGLLPRSLPPPISYNANLSSGSLSVRCFAVTCGVRALAACAAVQKDLWSILVAVIGCVLVIAPLWALASVVPSVLG